MRRTVIGIAVLGACTLFPAESLADEPCTPMPASAPQTWGASATTLPTPANDDVVTRARELLARAQLLDRSAASDERVAKEVAARLPLLRTRAKAARDRAERASGDEREILIARAEDLEADLVVSEAEATTKRRTAIANRRMARELRARAVQTVREAPADDSSVTQAPCEPPYRFTANGHRVYRIECLK